MVNKILIQPFLKWPGGKRWLIQKHSQWFIKTEGKHIEPFLGSAAAFFHLQPKTSLLSDINHELIETYLAIRDFPHEVRTHLEKHQRLHSKNYYYHIRSSKPRKPSTRAARFIYLNRTCFNGLYRVNLSGEFNVPIGTKSSVILPSDDFLKSSELLSRSLLYPADFEEIINLSNEGDFLYIDPPYTVKHNNNNFIKYNERIFSWDDQVRLSRTALSAAKRGVFVLISNANHQSIHALYQDKIWRKNIVSRYSSLASSSQHRKNTSELIISNYISHQGSVVSIRT